MPRKVRQKDESDSISKQITQNPTSSRSLQEHPVRRITGTPVTVSKEIIPKKSWYEMVEEEQQQITTSTSNIPSAAIMASLASSKEFQDLISKFQTNTGTSSSVRESDKGKAIATDHRSQQMGTQTVSRKPDNAIVEKKSTNAGLPFVQKPNFQKIVSIEKHFYDQSPWQTLQRFFGPKQFFKPVHPLKDAYYYQAILEICESVEIKHFFLNESHTDPAYSTFKILDIMSPQEWIEVHKGTLSDEYAFSDLYKSEPYFQEGYCYWDYQQAWFHALYIQNTRSRHTWLIFFDHKQIDASKFPFWFIQWWEQFGTTQEWINQKPQITASFNTFKLHYKPLLEETHFSLLALFHTKFYLPWVLSWYVDYSQITIPIIQRKFQIKWWNSFNVSPALHPSAIVDFCQFRQKAKAITPPIITPDHKQFLTDKSQLAAKLAAAKSPEEMQRLISQYAQTASHSKAASSEGSQTSPAENEDLL